MDAIFKVKNREKRGIPEKLSLDKPPDFNNSGYGINSVFNLLEYDVFK